MVVKNIKKKLITSNLRNDHESEDNFSGHRDEVVIFLIINVTYLIVAENIVTTFKYRMMSNDGNKSFEH